jgi:hypothetical protein
VGSGLRDTDADTIAEFAYRHRISRSKVYEEIKAGRLIASKVGTRTIITNENAAAWRRSLPTIQPDRALNEQLLLTANSSAASGSGDPR